MERIGWLLAAGIQILSQKEVPETTGKGEELPRPQRTANFAADLIIKKFSEATEWTPKKLKAATGLSGYRIKTMLAALLRAGHVTKTGATRVVAYRRTKEGGKHARAA